MTWDDVITTHSSIFSLTLSSSSVIYEGVQRWYKKGVKLIINQAILYVTLLAEQINSRAETFHIIPHMMDTDTLPF